MKYIFKKRNETPSDPEVIQKLMQEHGVSGILAELLLVRGTAEEAGSFLNPDIRNMHDPYLFSDMKKTVSLIRAHIRAGKKIAVYGDYDSDGICASSILYLILKKMNAKTFVYLPNRSDGYGLSEEAVLSMSRAGIKMLITVDCGISNTDEIKTARKEGMTVIVTDHHECPEELPEADAILNPKRQGETYPFRELAGGGVAFKLAVALAGKEAFEVIDLAAVATIGDVVPLLGENRIISAKGLFKMNRSPSLGLEVLMREAGFAGKPIDSGNVAFGLVPRINASGRIEDPKTALELLCGEMDGAALEERARKLCTLNAKRREMQEKIIDQALKTAEEYADARILVLQNDEWDAGIVGLAASALAGAYAKPAMLFGSRDGLYVGSARSIPGVNIFEALRESSRLLKTFGGHEAAAGMSIKKENLPVLREEMNRYMFERYTAEDFMRKAFYDIETSLAQVTGGLVCEIQKLKPFGCGNEPVKVLLRDVRVEDKRSVGNGSHSRLRIAQGGTVMDAVAFKKSCGEIPDRMDVLATPQINDFNGNTEVILDVISF
jgi:single-stranded-DNA-specific exonuclease